MDRFEKCVEATKDPQFCSYLYQINQLINGLAGCVVERGAEECFRECLKRCRGEGCEETCLGALEVAVGTAVAREVVRRAALVAALLGADLINAVALIFSEELKSAEAKECPDKAVAARILSIAAVELFMNLQKAAESSPKLRDRVQSLLLLAAPALAAAYQCVGEEVFEYLETVRPLIGEEMTKRIVAALEEGAVLVGGVVINFKPVENR
jgi:hypothetical protein